jgi:hypothetical protein
MLKNKSEIEKAAIRLLSMVKLKGAVLKREFDDICSGLGDKEKLKVLRKLKRKKIILESGIIQFSKEVIGDEEKRQNELMDYITRRSPLKVTADHIELNQRFIEGIVATGFPITAKEGWFEKIVVDNINYDYTMYLVPEASRSLEIYLSQQLKQVEEELHAFIQKGNMNADLERMKKHLVGKIDALKKNEYKIFKMAFYFATKGVNEETSKKTGNAIMSNMHSAGIEGKFATNYQKQLYLSTIPTTIDRLKGRQIFVPSTVLSKTFPFRK